MKKLFTIAVIALICCMQADAQKKTTGNWTFNTRAWSTNYWTTIIGGAVENTLKEFIFDGEDESDKWVNAILPDIALVFPVGIEKKGFGEGQAFDRIYGPYHRAFGSPFKHVGDYAIGADASYKPSLVGAYAGVYFKSQEIVEKSTKESLRGFYVQPRAGLVLGKNDTAVEAGVFFDIVTGCGGNRVVKDKDMLKGGVGLDFALSQTASNGRRKEIVQFSLPLHNFINEDFQNGALKGLKRRVGYIMLTERVVF